MEKLIWRERYPGVEETGAGHHGDYFLHLQEDGHWHAYRLSALNRTGEVEADLAALPVLYIGSYASLELAKRYIEEHRTELESKWLPAVYSPGGEDSADEALPPGGDNPFDVPVAMARPVRELAGSHG